MKKTLIKQKIHYWIENKISNSPISLIRLMAIATVMVSIIVTVLITIFGTYNKENFLYTFWDTFASSINAWLPSANDGDYNIINIILISLSSLFGLFFTSLLIGVVTNLLEERIESIKKGNSAVLEKDHVIILGFVPGEYTLIKELIKGANNNKLSIVIADDFEKEEVESLIRDNVSIPKNIKIICRSIDICNATSLNLLAIDKCRSIIVTPMNDERAVKTIFSINYLFDTLKRNDCVVVATIRDKNFVLPETYSKNNNTILLVLTDFVARIIARTCVQQGLSLVYLELFNNKNSEIYAKKCPEFISMSFKDIYLGCDGGVPIGIINDNNHFINPSSDYRIKDEDSLVFIAENKDGVLRLKSPSDITNKLSENSNYYKNLDILILGYNDSVKTIINELPRNINSIKIAGVGANKINDFKAYISNISDISIDICNESIDDMVSLEKLVKDVDRVIVLNNYDKDGSSADIKVMLRLTKLRDIRERLNLDFTISIEFRRAANRTLIHKDDYTDYIVRSNMFSMFLSQLSSNPSLEPIYNELLSPDNNDICLLPSTCIENINNYLIKDIRKIIYNSGSLFLGYIKRVNGRYVVNINPSLNEKLELNDNDSIVIIKNKN